jgi:hypothetical protein
MRFNVVNDPIQETGFSYFFRLNDMRQHDRLIRKSEWLENGVSEGSDQARQPRWAASMRRKKACPSAAVPNRSKFGAPQTPWTRP